jgi:lipopolysaccharide biosynthesis glycosyltransferase
MKTKIVYVVTSDETDVYLEQALLSVFSLRKHNPNAYVELVVDQDTDATITGKRGEILKYIDNKVVVNVPKEYNKVCRSRWLKTSLRQHVKGDFLYIDTDTIVTDNLEDIDCFIGDIGAVRDQHVLLGKNRGAKKIQIRAEQEGWSWSETLVYYNGGIIFVKDSAIAHEFYQMWNNKWKDKYRKTGDYKDQPPLAATNESFQFPIRELPGEWNCQIARNGILYLTNAKIMHYYGRTHPWIFYNHDILNEIKELGHISDKISKMVDEAKSSFDVPNMIISGEDLECLNYKRLIHTPLFSICKANRRVFYLFNNAAKILQKAIKIKHRIQDLL